MTKRWRLMIFDAPDSLGGLLARHGFQRTKKNPNHWWRVFDPATDREAAEAARSDFRSAGLKGKWSEVDHTIRHGSFTRRTQGTSGGFGGPLNAKPIAGSWRMRKHR